MENYQWKISKFLWHIQRDDYYRFKESFEEVIEKIEMSNGYSIENND